MELLLVGVVVGILALLVGMVMGYLGGKRWPKRRPIKGAMFSAHDDVQRLVDDGLLQVVGVSAPKVTLRNMSSKHISLTGFGMQIQPGASVRLDRPDKE